MVGRGQAEMRYGGNSSSEVKSTVPGMGSCACAGGFLKEGDKQWKNCLSFIMAE